MSGARGSGPSRVARARMLVAALAAMVAALVVVLLATGGGPSSPTATVRFLPTAAQRPLPAGPATGGRPANVVLLLTDDQTLADMEVMPRTRQLVGGAGATFDQYRVSFPLCCPARATILTGQYSHNSGVLGNNPPLGGYGALVRHGERKTVPFALSHRRRQPYRTAHIGKYLNGYGKPRHRGIPPGWTDWYGATEAYRMWGYQLNENGKLKTYGQRRVEDPRFYQTDVFRRKAVRFVRGQAAPGRAPFFLSLSFVAPHSETGLERPFPGRNPRSAPRHRGQLADEPLARPPSFDEADMSDKPAWLNWRHPLGAAGIEKITARYRARRESLLAVDEAVAAIVGALRESGQLQRTYVIFTSDNGFFHGEHRVPGGKLLAYEPATHVPMMIRGPGIPAGVRSELPAGDVDLGATILDMTRTRARWPLDGRSLLDHLRPRLRAQLEQRPMLQEIGPSAAGGDLDQDGGSVGVRLSGPRIPQYWGVLQSGIRYVRYEDGSEELYDLRRDPDELASKHADPSYAATKRALQTELERLRHCRGPSCRAPAPPLPRPR
ncbi:sulfatase family protein [Patulibacter defluvii]|uniref:sulfatase family protein n=1 Tax=Patulibacter defluvii TaxID=3095358 RepID=UPI002A74D6ED|nr:sulfatase [Patulibacter sp. DM4]